MITNRNNMITNRNIKITNRNIMVTIPGLRIMYVRLFQPETGVFGLRRILLGTNGII